MPFDPLDFPPTDPQPETPRRDRRSEDLLLAAIVVVLFGLFLLPIGGGSIPHLIAYLLR